MTVWMSYLYSTLQVSSRKHSLEPMLNPNKQLRQLLSFFSPSSWLEPLSVSLHFTSPSPSLHLLASFSTKPCHRHDCGHVNHLASIICSQLFTSSQTKESAFFVVAGVECCVDWGLLFNSACHFPSPSLKNPIQHRESMKWERRQGGKMSL